jgi:hypothetical protein
MPSSGPCHNLQMGWIQWEYQHFLHHLLPGTKHSVGRKCLKFKSGPYEDDRDFKFRKSTRNSYF